MNLRKKLIRLAFEQTELRPHLLPLLKTSGDKAQTPEGAKKLFDAYKERYPGTKKQPKDFFERPETKQKPKEKIPAQDKPSKVVSQKDLEKTNKALEKEKAAAQQKAKSIKVPEKAQQTFKDLSLGRKVTTVAATAGGASAGYVLGGALTSAAIGTIMAGLGITAVAGLPALGIGLGILAGALVVGYLGAKSGYELGSGLKRKGEELTEDRIKELIVDKMHNLDLDEAEALKSAFEGGKLNKKKLLSFALKKNKNLGNRR